MASDDGPIGILSAMPQEVAKLQEHVTDQQEHKFGIFSFTTGTLEGKKVVFAFSNIGMTFCASVATTMCNHFNVRCILFTGVAGGLQEGQQIGDLVLGAEVVNHDMDCTGFVMGPKTHVLGEIPFVGWRFYEADKAMLKLAQAWEPPAGVRVSTGKLASGSVFISSEEAKLAFNATKGAALGNPVAVEMENAGVAQICRAYDKPYLSLRALSDLLKGDANADFNAFCQQAADNTFPLVSHMVRGL